MSLLSRRGLFWVGVLNATLLATLCIIFSNRKSDTREGYGNLAFEKQNRHSTDQTSDVDYSPVARKKDLEALAEAPQPSSLQEQSATDRLPLEWEGPVIAVLNNNYPSSNERNQALVAMALQTARHVPRVQQECLMHLAYGLRDDDYEIFLKLSTDISIPIGVRLKFIDEVFSIRPKELTNWLGQSLRMSTDPALISRAQDFLKKQEESELFYKSQPEPPFQETESSPRQPAR